MADDMLEKIKAAEAQADQIVADARSVAAQRARALEEELEGERGRALQEAREQAQRIERDALEKASADSGHAREQKQVALVAQALEARRAMPQAVALILDAFEASLAP